MPSKKQRRRRQKERRHEYEYVYVDEEGQEVEVEPEANGQAKKTDRKERQPATRGGRPIEPPSWNRVAKRGLLFAPLMFITISILGKNESATVHIARTAFLLLIFLPFSYVMDALIYRSHQRRMARKGR